MHDNSREILSKVLITGANGVVGSYIDFGIKLDHRSLDITDLNEVLSVVSKHSPKFIVHLAAETDVERCERDPQHAYIVNSIGTYNIALAAKSVRAKMIYISTSAVFDGLDGPYTENDACNPQSYYAKSKFLGELIVQGVLDDYVIGRACWMFGGGSKLDKKFISAIIQKMREPEIKVVKKRFGSPTYAKDLAGAIKKMILNNDREIFHISNEGNPSRVDIAKEIVKITGSATKITEVEPSFFSHVYSDQKENNEGMLSKVKIMRSWQDALKDYIKEEWSDYIMKR